MGRLLSANARGVAQMKLRSMLVTTHGFLLAATEEDVFSNPNKRASLLSKHKWPGTRVGVELAT
jgi:hypothetical protein